MDRVERVRYIADLDSELKREDHLARLEVLEAESGLDLDVYAAIYGRDFLDGTNDTAVKLRQNWAEFLTALKSDHRYKTILYPYQVPIPGCHGKDEPRKNVINMVIIDGAAEVSAVNVSETEASYVVKGDHILYWNGSELTTQTMIQLAAASDDRIFEQTERDKSSRILGADSKIIVTDNRSSLYVELSDVLDSPQNSGIFSTNPYFAVIAALREYDESLTQKELV